MIREKRTSSKFHRKAYVIFSLICLALLITVVILARRSSCSKLVYEDYRAIGFPVRLPRDGPYVQWIFLHLNDVYEIVPLDRGEKGGLARVAHIRQLLKKENDHTYTILAGDFLSPSALSTAKVNGTKLNGRQMVDTLNHLGLDFVTFGNHEFDLNENDLLQRMNASEFTWISSNVAHRTTKKLVGPSLSHYLLRIEGVRVLLIGLSIDKNDVYVEIVNRTSLIDYVQRFLQEFPRETYDVLVAITHLDIAMDRILAERIPQIDLILGGHEHENQYYLRGNHYTPIYKADGNAMTVYILRCAFHVHSKKFHIDDTLLPITSDIAEEKTTAAIVKYWFDLGMEGFRQSGYEPSEIVACLPSGVELDGLTETVRSRRTLLTDLICEGMIHSSQASKSTVALFNTGAIRLDDVLRETITEYDILRTLPFPNPLVIVHVPGRLLNQLLLRTRPTKGLGSLLAYCGLETADNGQTWFVNGREPINDENFYNVTTIEYTRMHTLLKNVAVLERLNVTQTRSFINYLKFKYPSC